MRTDAHTNCLFDAIDPRNGESLGTFASAGPAEIAAAAAEAYEAFLAHKAEPERRVILLEEAAAGLRREAAAIVAAAESETGLPQVRLEGELERTARQLEAFAAVVARGDYVDAHIDPPDPEAKPIPRPDVRRMLVPIGPVAVFGASNFPLAFSVAGGDTASALAAGCPVVVKGHPAHPGTSRLVADVVARAVATAGLPAGWFTLLNAGGRSVGEELVDQEEIAAVAFTGSFAAGMALFRRAAARPRPIPVFAEMSSVNPLIVTPGAVAARGEAIAAGLAAAIGGSAGQLCTKPGLIFLPVGGAATTLGATVADLLAQQGPQVMLTAGVRKGLLDRTAVLDRLAEPIGSAPSVEVEGPGFRVSPRLYTTDSETLAATPELREEAFGPVALLVRYADQNDLSTALGSLDGQLTGTLHAEEDEIEEAAPVIAALERMAGRVILNDYPTGVAVTSAMVHGGPFPATTDAGQTSVGMTAITRFLRPIAWQNMSPRLLPAELRDENPRGLARRIDGRLEPPAA